MGTPVIARDLLSSLGSHPSPGILLDASKSESGKSTELKSDAVSCFPMLLSSWVFSLDRVLHSSHRKLPLTSLGALAEQGLLSTPS